MASAPDDAFLVSSTTALEIAENLVLLLDTMISNLPENELRKMRCALGHSLRIADDILFKVTVSSTFDMFSFSDASTIPGVDISATGFTSLPRTPVRNTNTNIPCTLVPPPSPVTQTVTIGDNVPTALTDNDPVDPGQAVMDHSYAVVTAPSPSALTTPTEHESTSINPSRSRFGRPDYRLHPAFVDVDSGIPGKYVRPPVDSTSLDPAAYYVVTKGLYVGIFTSWRECSPWVTAVPGSVFCKARQWTEAMSLYNARLESGSCEVLS